LGWNDNGKAAQSWSAGACRGDVLRAEGTEELSMKPTARPAMGRKKRGTAARVSSSNQPATHSASVLLVGLAGCARAGSRNRGWKLLEAGPVHHSTLVDLGNTFPTLNQGCAAAGNRCLNR
jgi:hypothetical protein